LEACLRTQTPPISKPGQTITGLAARPASRRAAVMPRSAIREIMALAARPGIIHLEVGEPDFSTPLPIIDAAFAAVRAGATKYSPNAGLATLRQRVAQRVSSAWNKEVSVDRVIITTGAIGALYSAVMSVTDPGDEVLIPDPGWPNYEAIVHLAGGVPVRFQVSPHSGFVPDVAEIAKLITARTKAIVINSPGNPTGAVFPAQIMRDICAIAQRTGIYVISDEVYEDIIFAGQHVSAGAVGPADRVFVVSGFSKTYAMTGWRLGWLVCPEQLAPIAAGLQEPVTSCASTIAQKAGEAALEGDQAVARAFRDTFMRRRDLLVEVFGNTGLLPVMPRGAFYALIDVAATGRGSFDFARDLLEVCSTAVVPGITFGPSCDRYVRIAFTIAENELREGLQRLRAHIERLAQASEFRSSGIR
jgi:aspartate aminotransferase/aminotransferase